MNIFVARLNYETREPELRDAFEDFGEVDSVKIIMDRYTGSSKGFGFVEMPHEEEALDAIDALNDEMLDGRTLVVKKAKKREDRRSRTNYNSMSW